jgi:uncharacterized membrane protein YfhO
VLLGLSAKKASDQLKISGFSPNAIQVKTNTKKQQLLVLQQSFQSQWKAKIDGKSTSIVRVNKNYQAIILPAGKHTITFKTCSKCHFKKTREQRHNKRRKPNRSIGLSALRFDGRRN